MAKADPAKLKIAEDLVLAGASVNRAARESGITYGRAKKLHDSLKAEGRLTGAVPAGSDGEDLYDLTLQVRGSNADAIFSMFTVEEKLNAISNVLQERLNKALGEEDDGDDS